MVLLTSVVLVEWLYYNRIFHLKWFRIITYHCIGNFQGRYIDFKVRSHITFVFVSPLTHSFCCVTIDACLIGVRKRSCGKVMFLHLSVILVGGEVYTHPLGRHPPPTATAADGTHPNGMHSWFKVDVDTSPNVKCEQSLRFVYYINLACTGVIASKSSNLYFREHYRHYVIKKF